MIEIKLRHVFIATAILSMLLGWGCAMVAIKWNVQLGWAVSIIVTILKALGDYTVFSFMEPKNG